MDTTSAPYLSSGRRVTLLPRTGGQSWTGAVRRWDAMPAPHVVANVETTRPAVTALDHHQLWLSTVNAADGEYGITTFAGRAAAVGDELLEIDGVVRLATEPRRRAACASRSGWSAGRRLPRWTSCCTSTKSRT